MIPGVYSFVWVALYRFTERIDASFVATSLYALDIRHSCASLGDSLAVLRYAAKIYWPFVMNVHISTADRSSVMASRCFITTF